jgi:ATP-dependent Clp protease protease subunit
MPCPDEEKEEKEERGVGIISAKLLKARTILINGPIEEDLGERVITQALVLDSDSHEPIRVLVTTPGGMVDVGFAIYDILRYVESKVICIGAGFVASMGVPIMLSVPRQDRYTLPNTRFMMHQPSTGAAGVASDIRITAQSGSTSSSPRKPARPSIKWPSTATATSGCPPKKPSSTGSYPKSSRTPRRLADETG